MSAVAELDPRTAGTPRRARDLALAGRGPVGRALADALPIVVGYLPFGLILGARLASSTLPTFIALGTSPLIFAGAAQLAMVELLDAGAAPAVIVLTALVVNARLVVYSGAIGHWLRGVGRPARLGIAALLTDPLYVLASVRLPDFGSASDRRRYVVAAGLVLWVGWLALTAIGMVAGGHLPEQLPLDLAVPLTFLGLLVPTLTSRPAVASALTAGTVAVLARNVPFHLGLLLATGAGILVGILITARRTS